MQEALFLSTGTQMDHLEFSYSCKCQINENISIIYFTGCCVYYTELKLNVVEAETHLQHVVWVQSFFFFCLFVSLLESMFFNKVLCKLQDGFERKG